jgi:hypothetical protein
MRDLIIKHNPWWKNQEDVMIKKWESTRIRWVPKWIDKIGLQPFSLNFIIGPRQIGKTTGVKLLIQKLLKKRAAESIFYFNCDFVPDINYLKKLLDTYLEFKKSENVESSFIFLDEITSVPEWWRVVKGYIDLGVFENDVVTITGSSSLKLKGETELFPGRRGKGKDIVVHPLSFREFLGIHGIKVKTAENPEKGMKRLLKREDEIRNFFSLYTKTGGFPLSVNEDPTAEEQFLAGFEGEVLKSKHNLQLMKEVISSILRKAPSPLSLSTIGRDVGVSYKTIQDYTEVLKSFFVMDTAFYKDRKRIVWRKERKFFFLDPFITNTLSSWCGEEYLDSAFYEWLVQSHLLRKFGSVFYFRDSFEIDCIANDLKVEVKIGKPHRRYPDDVLILDSETLPLFLSVVV